MPSSRPIIVLVIIATAVLGACQAAGSSAAPSAGRVDVSISDAGCSPSAITVPSGSVAFAITNTGADTGEFEIMIENQRVVDEVENIVPGFVVNMTTRLDGRTYQLLCGNHQAPTGVLTVTGGVAPSVAPNAVVAEAKLAAARDTYATYVKKQAADFVTSAGAFTAAVEAGDLAKAKVLYGPARVPYERMEPIAELFPDLDKAIDFRQEDFGGGVTDPEFKGFHRIEKGLFADGSTTGLDGLAKELQANAVELKTRVDALTIEPRVMARGAGELIEEVAQSKMTGEEDRYSKDDLYSIRANVDGSAEIVNDLRPILTTLDSPYLAQLDAADTAVDQVIDRYATSDGFKGFDQITPADLKLLQARLADLSELLAELPGRLGLAA